MSGGKRTVNKIPQQEVLSKLIVKRDDSLNIFTEGIFVIGDGWRCLYANNAAINFCQSTPEALLNKSILSNHLFNRKSRLCQEITNCQNTGNSSLFQDKYTLADGTESVFEIKISPVKDAVIVILHDITRAKYVESCQKILDKIELKPEQSTAEQELLRLNHILMAIRRINQLITKIKDVRQLLESACSTLSNIPGLTNCWAVQFDADTRVIEAVHAGKDENVDEDKDISALKAELKNGHLPFCLKAAVNKMQTVRFFKCEQLCHGCPKYQETKTDRNVIVSPLIYGQKILGALVGAMDGRVISNDQETKLFEEVADDLGLALNNLELEQQRIQAEKKLAASEELYRMITQNAKDLITRIKLKPNPEMEYVSPSAADILGYQPEEMIYDFAHGKRYVYPEDREELNRRLEIAPHLIEPIQINRWLHKDGRTVWIEQRSKPILDSAGNVTAVIGVGRDITERVAAEKALSDEVMRRRILVEQSIVGIVVIDEKGKVFESNRKFAEMIGYSPEEMSRLSVLDWEAQISPKKLGEMVRNDHGFIHFETKHRRKDGTTYDVEIDSSSTIIADQRLMFCVCKDITERIRAEKALRESEDKFSKAFQNSAISMSINTLREGRFIEINKAFNNILDFSSEEAIGHTAGELGLWVDPSDRSKLEKLVSENSCRNLEIRLRAKNSRVLTFLFSAERMDVGDEPSVLLLLQDITERKKAEAQIRLNEARLESLLKISQYEDPDIQKLLDFAIEEAVHLTGSLGGFIGNYHPELGELEVVCWSGPVPEVFEARGPAYFIKLKNVEITGEVIRQKKAVIINHFQDFHPSPKGLPADLVKLSNFMAVPILSGGNIVAVAVVGNKPTDYNQSDLLQLTLLIDATWKMVERRRVEKERKQAAVEVAELYQKEKQQRLELQEEARARGMFIDVLAHELRTPLTPILASTGMMKDVLEGSPDSIQKKLASNILTSAQTLARRLEELLDVARYSRGTFKLNLQPMDLNKFIDDVIIRFRPMTDQRNQKLVFETHGNLPIVEIDPLRLEKVLVNLLSNASKFSEVNGEVFFRVDVDEAGVLFEIKDNGIGITPEEQARLFQPYHRVEQDRQKFPGIGLGLAVAKQIIEAHKGKIWLTSQPGQGSTFNFRIPFNKSN